MPIELSYTKDNGIIIKAAGNLNAQDLMDVNSKIYENEEKIKSIKYQLCDFTDVEGVIVTSNDIQSIANQDNRAASLNSDMICAIVGNQDVIYGLARMWQSYLNESGYETAVFRSVEQAKEWIDSKIKK